MRYVCPSCGRIYYLETKVESPCPACGTMLQVRDDDAGGDEAQESTGGGSWLIDEAEASSLGPGPSVGLQAEPSEPQPSEKTPSAAAFLSGGEAAAAGPGGGPDVQDAVDQLRSAAQSGQSQMATSVFPAAQRAPSGMKVLWVTAASILIALAVASAALLLLPKDGAGVADVGPVSTASDAAEIARLKVTIKEVRKEKSGIKEERDTAKAAHEAAENQLAEASREVELLKAGMVQHVEATAKTLAALELLERRVELATAMRLAVDALRADPDFVQAHRLRGRILAASGRSDEAFTAFGNADEAARKPGGVGDIEALVLAGELALTNFGDRKKAAAYYRRAAEIEADSALGLVAQARGLMLTGNLADGDVKAKAAEEKAPSFALAPLVRGEIAFQRAATSSGSERSELMERAGALLDKALRLDPNSTRACLARGRLLLEEAKLASGSPSFGLVRLHPQARAESLLSRAFELSPKLPEVHVALAELLLGEGALRNPAAAKIRAREAVRLTDGKNAGAIATLAAAESASGDPKAAAETMSKALKLEPENRRYRELHQRYKTESDTLRKLR